MLTDATLIDLIGVIYDAATDPQQWSVFLEKVVSLFSTGVATFDFFDLQSRRGGTAATIGISPDQARSYVQYYSARNDLFPKIAAAGLLLPGAIIENRTVYEDADFARTEYCADFLVKQVGVFHALGSALARSDSVSSGISILRKRSHPFENEERRFLAALVPHLQRSVSIWQRVAAAEIDRALAVGGMDHLPTATVVLDASGAVAVMNPAAKRVLNSDACLTVRGNRLVATRTADRIQLQQLIDSAIGKSPPRRGGLMSIERISARPLVISVAPLTAATGALIVLSDPEQEIEPDLEALRRIHGLTCAEAQLASSLLRGNTLKEAAGEMKITFATARTHMKRILMKTNTRRQSELLMLLQQTLSAVPRPD